MASPDKSPVLNILKEFEQSSYNAPENTFVEESTQNPQELGDRDRPPKPLSVEEDLNRSNSWDIPKAPITPSAWRTVKKPWQETIKFDNYKEKEAAEIQLDRRERELERQERELDRRSREIDRRERELDRRQREFDRDRIRWPTEINTTPPQWTTAIETLKNKMEAIVLKERINSEKRELELEARMVRKVNEALEREHQIMQMSDNEVNEIIEDTVGYLLHKDEDIADRVRFQSLVYLAQERLAIEAGLPALAQERLSTVWIMAIGPSVVTEDRYNKAMEILKKRYETFSDATMKLIDCKPAMEFLVEYTSHLKKEGLEQSFVPGRIPPEAYMESIERQVKKSGVNGEALTIVVDFVCQDLEKSANVFQPTKPSESTNPSESAKPSESTNFSEYAKPSESKPAQPPGP